MTSRVLAEKIKEYPIANAIDQEKVLQELVQQYLLASLSRAGFFSRAGAIFHGGTCLRVIFGMNRFSEDLDFFLKRPDPEFTWRRYLDQAGKDAAGDGLHLSLTDKSDGPARNKEKGAAVKKAMVRFDPASGFMGPDLPFGRDVRKLIKVKLEIDTNPPAGSNYETRYIAFPMTAALTAQTLESGFGMKLSALLTRGYVKGRDWYDFVWYINKKIAPNLALLENALKQLGPWAGQNVRIGADWVVERLKEKIAGIDWKEARQDVQRFLPLSEQETLKLWAKEFFLHYAGLLGQLM